ncbi:MAG: hypothetical protein HC815_30895 [Richelia sp. RM1_1_1]|nr:hypothetical protein [Richelia sp. RM1_1_1]
MPLNLEEAIDYGERLQQLASAIGHYGNNGVAYAALLKRMQWDSYKLQVLVQILISSKIITVTTRGGLYYYFLEREFKGWASEFEEVKSSK